MMNLHNTLTKKIEEINPLNSPVINIYTCGPTVYDFTHIGHWFTYVRMDMLIRVLKASGFKPYWVMNITDVGHLVSDSDEGEDKLVSAARKENKTAWEIAEFYTKDFLTGLESLNILMPDKIVKATNHITDQINLILKLEKKGYTYVIDDGVYYDTSKFPKYNDFANLDLDEQQTGARIDVNTQKKQSQDFALWKFSPKDLKRDMEWDSPWGIGFPGWHIECSAMSMKYLGETIDIHTGGIDHIPIHHTNEIAQSEAATGKQLSKYWMHSNHVLFDGQKISKSLGNIIKLSDLKTKNISPEALRLHILESHYRNQSRFNWDSLIAASHRLDDLKAMAALKYQLTDKVIDYNSLDLKLVPENLKCILQNDLNTPEALAYLSSVSTQILKSLITIEKFGQFTTLIKIIDEQLGLKLTEICDISLTEKQLIKERELARNNNDWLEADKIRDSLEKKKIGVRDTVAGPIWFPIS